MGGGGAMRAAAKAAGLGLPNAGLRGGFPENFAAARNLIRRSPSAVSSTASVDDTSRIEFTAASQTPPALAWELDDWEFDGYIVEEQPRLVFGPAPSLEEAKEATSELRDALDKMYFSPSNSAGSYGSVSAVDEHGVVSKSATLLTDTKACVLNQNSDVPTVPNQALQAFKMLKENPAAQNVVSSIVADPNVWKAVLENEDLKEYLRAQKISGMESKEQNPLNTSEDSLDEDAGNSENLLMNVFENIKLSVAGWMNNLSGFFQDWFVGSDDKSTSGEANSFSSSTAVSRSLLGLAVMVIMVVLMKRG